MKTYHIWKEGGGGQMGAEKKNLSGYVIFPFCQPLEPLTLGCFTHLRYDPQLGFKLDHNLVKSRLKLDTKFRQSLGAYI